MSQANQGELTEKQLADLKEIFDLADSDGSGAISIQELNHLMESVLGMDVSEEEVKNLVEDIDSNNDGQIQFEEFLAVMSRKMKTGCSAEDLRKAFRVFEGSAPPGTITIQGLEDLLCDHGTRRLSREDARKLISQLKLSTSDGLFAYEDYIANMTLEQFDSR